MKGQEATRVIVPYTDVTQGTDQCLRRLAPQAERVYVGDDVLDYWRLMCRVWADGEDFVVWEHDVQCDDDAISVLEDCPRPICSTANYFRQTRFRAEVMAAIPRVFEETPMSERHWITLEWSVRERIGRTFGGWHMHQVGTFNDNRGMLGLRAVGVVTSAQRAPIWFEWLRSLPPEYADRHTAKAHAYFAKLDGSDGSACDLAGCSRSSQPIFHPVHGWVRGRTCRRCEADSWSSPSNAPWPPTHSPLTRSNE